MWSRLHLIDQYVKESVEDCGLSDVDPLEPMVNESTAVENREVVVVKDSEGYLIRSA
jgi:hypothetical protein